MSCRTLDSKRERAALVPRIRFDARIKFAAGVRGLSMQFNTEHSPRLAHCPKSQRSSDANTVCKNLPLDWDSVHEWLEPSTRERPPQRLIDLLGMLGEIDGTESSNPNSSRNEMHFEVE